MVISATCKDGDFTDTQPCLQHELDYRIIPRRQPVRRGAGGAQQGVNFDIRQTSRLLVTHHAHRTHIPRGVSHAETRRLVPNGITDATHPTGD